METPAEVLDQPQIEKVQLEGLVRVTQYPSSRVIEFIAYHPLTRTRYVTPGSLTRQRLVHSPGCDEGNQTLPGELPHDCHGATTWYG